MRLTGAAKPSYIEALAPYVSRAGENDTGLASLPATFVK